MKKTKRVFSILLAMLMLITAIPFAVSAESEISGVCGDNLTWSFDEATGVLTISGTGDMWDYPDSFNNDFTSATWNTLYLKVKDVVVEEGVTSIGDGAFCGFSVQNIVFPETLTKIGRFAFWECPLKSVVIPDGVRIIEEGAFSACYSLEHIALSNNIEKIGDLAFHYTKYYNDPSYWENGVLYIDNCLYSANYQLQLEEQTYEIKNGTRIICDGVFSSTHIKNIILPDSLKYIGEGSIGNGLLESISFSSGNNPNFKLVDGVLYSADGNTLVMYPSRKEGAFFEIPEGTEIIRGYAIAGTGIEKLSIPSSLKDLAGDEVIIENYLLKEIVCKSKTFSILKIIKTDNPLSLPNKRGKELLSYYLNYLKEIENVTGDYNAEEEITVRLVNKYFGTDLNNYEEAQLFLDEVIQDTFLPTVYVYSGSVAEKECVENNIPYKLICEEHSYTSTITKQPTCTQKGIETFVCEACGEIYTEAISATGHTDKDKNNKCDKCGVSLDNNSDNCICHKRMSGKIYKVLYKIVRVYWKLFGINKTCSCGVKHY